MHFAVKQRGENVIQLSHIPTDKFVIAPPRSTVVKTVFNWKCLL